MSGHCGSVKIALRSLDMTVEPLALLWDPERDEDGQAGEWREEANFREGHLETVFSDMCFSKPYIQFS